MIVNTFGHLNDIRTLSPLPHAKFMFVPYEPGLVKKQSSRNFVPFSYQECATRGACIRMFVVLLAVH